MYFHVIVVIAVDAFIAAQIIAGRRTVVVVRRCQCQHAICAAIAAESD